MNCAEIQAALPALLYGDLPPGQAAALREHLASCPACREEETGLRQVTGLLNTMPAPVVQVNLTDIYQEASRRQLRRVRLWRRLAVSLSAAAAALLLVVGLRLELRVDAHQVVVRWGTSPELPQSDPVQPAPGLAAVNAEHAYLTQQLIHALADDVAARDRENQDSLGTLEARLEALQQQQQERWDATQRLVSTLYTLTTTSVAKRSEP
jgi:anti-sigma factor RsiW